MRAADNLPYVLTVGIEISLMCNLCYFALTEELVDCLTCVTSYCRVVEQ